MGQDGWHISAVEVKAFKSFPGAFWAHFEVSDGLTGILGPNGSGKSNLLEAICFASGCSSTLLRGCRTLRDVTSTDAGSQLPQVRLEVQKGEGSRAEHHLLETSLTPEGTRAYKLDGRIKTGTQIRDFLSSCGMVVDHTTVIQQASVTRLTESNNAANLSDLVSTASGLNSWNQETAVARQEINRTRKALKDIQSNITKVQTAAAVDEAAVQATLDANRMEGELEALLERLVEGIQQRQSSLQLQMTTAEEKQQQLQAADANLATNVQTSVGKKQDLLAKQAQVQAEAERHSSSSSATGTLAGQIAATKSEIAVLQTGVAAASNLASNLESCNQQLLLQEGKVQQLEAILQAKQKNAREAKASVAAAELATTAAEGLQQQLARVQMQASSAATAVLQQQAVVCSCTGDYEQAEAKVTAANSKLETLPAIPAASTVPTAAAAVNAAAAAAQAQGENIHNLQQQLLQLQMDLELAESGLINPQTAALLTTCRSTSTNAASTTSTTTSSSSNIAVPLHSCFHFRRAAAAADAKQAAANQQLLVPLSVIAGPAVLQVLVTECMRDANTLLAAAAAAAAAAYGSNDGSSSGRHSSNRSGKLKIWPLDKVQTHNSLSAQRAAQQQLGPDKVIIPLDLFAYDKQYESAMVRAFGSYVITTDDATAAQLVQRFGISSVSMQGTVSKKGSLSGGWAGSSGGYAQKIWSRKVQVDAAAAQIAAAREELVQEVLKQQQLEDDRLRAEWLSAAVQQREAILRERVELQLTLQKMEAKLQFEQQQLSHLKQQHRQLQERLQACQAAASNSSSSKSGARAAAAAMKRQLQEDAAKAAAEVAEAQQQLNEAQEQVEQLAAQMETFELQLSSGNSRQQQEEQLQHLQQQLLQLQQQQADQETAQLTLQQQQQQLQQQVISAEQELQQLQQQRLDIQQQMKVVAAQSSQAAADLKQLRHDRRQLTRDFADSNAIQAVMGAAAGTPLGANSSRSTAAAAGLVPALDNINPSIIPSAKQLQQLVLKARQLQQQIDVLEVPELPAAVRELCQARALQVQQFRVQMEALAAAADGLEARIEGTAEQVHAANDAVYEDIAVGFSQLCSSLLPSLEVQLERTGSWAHEGLQFRFRRLEDATGSSSSSSSSDWHTSLSQLSGGQQTLVSLAMLLAVARSGNSSRLFLLDEVDAALDEHNQARAAALLKQLANAGGDGGCQILCVTHNAAFQQVCDAYVHVIRGPHGGTMAAAAADPVGGEKAADAAARVQDRAKQKQTAVGSKPRGRGAAARGSKKVKEAAVAAGAVKGAAAKGTATRSAKKVRFQM